MARVFKELAEVRIQRSALVGGMKAGDGRAANSMAREGWGRLARRTGPHMVVCQEVCSHMWQPYLKVIAKKGGRWLLLKRPENHTDKQGVKLSEIPRHNLKSVRSYLMI